MAKASIVSLGRAKLINECGKPPVVDGGVTHLKFTKQANKQLHFDLSNTEIININTV